MNTDVIEQANIFIKANKHKVEREYRLNYHLMGEYGWINDPNGLIQYKGTYQVFYQHYPYKSVWGPTYWGHAVSRDLIEWEYMPIALAPDCEYDNGGCFSGSAVEKDGKLFLIYTGNVFTGPDSQKDVRQTQCLAYSDDGIVFNKFDGNPIIDGRQIPENSSKADFRDPGIFQRGESFYAVIGTNDGHGRGQALLYRSGDLIEWEYLNVLAKGDTSMGVNWECPDLFQLSGRDIFTVCLQSIGNSGGSFYNADVPVYMSGSLDIEKGSFQYDDYRPLDYGFDFYAPQSMGDSKGRRIVLGWMNTWNVPLPTQSGGHNWAGAMTIPRVMELDGDRLLFKPVDEIENYRFNKSVLKNIRLNGEISFETQSDSYELHVLFDAGEASVFGLRLRTGGDEGTVLSYSREDRLFRFNRDKAGIGPKGERRVKVNLIDDKLELRIFVDKCSLETFINEGEKVMTGLIFPRGDSLGIKAFSKGDCTIELYEKWDIRKP